MPTKQKAKSGLKAKPQMNIKTALMILALAGSLGGYLVYKSFASDGYAVVAGCQVTGKSIRHDTIKIYLDPHNPATSFYQVVEADEIGHFYVTWDNNPAFDGRHVVVMGSRGELGRGTLTCVGGGPKPKIPIEGR